LIVKRPINDHGLKGLTVTCDTHNFIFSTLIVAIASSGNGGECRETAHVIKRLFGKWMIDSILISNENTLFI